MKRRNRSLWAAILVFCLCAASFMPAYGASSVISSVKITVSSKLEPGETLPEIGIGTSAEDGEINVSCSGSKYSIYKAEWVTSTSRTMEPGDTPEMKVWLDAEGDYYFNGSYKSSNVSISKGTFVSAKRENSDTLVVRLKVKGIEGSFNPPDEAYWKSNTKGTARWTAPDDGGTGKYEVVLRRGSSSVHTVETTGTSYNFYPYMTREGSYSFRVRTIAKTSSEEQYGKKSDWMESDEIYIAKEDVSDGTGQTSVNGLNNAPGMGNTQVGWQLVNGTWYYIFPDGSRQQNAWLQVSGQWYLFDDAGRMLKGWQQKNNQTYLLADSGAMVIGWVQANNRWYYLNPTPDQFQGCMLANRWLTLGDQTYFLGADGAMVEGWYQVDGNWYYFYPGSGNKAVNTTIDTFYVDQDGVWRR